MRTFHLGNADAKQTVNLLRTMLKTKDLYVDERTNMIVMRDTPDVVRAADVMGGDLRPHWRGAAVLVRVLVRGHLGTVRHDLDFMRVELGLDPPQDRERPHVFRAPA
jgi:hypothetical protein